MTAVTRVVEIATAAVVQPDHKPLFVGTVWIIDEIEQSLLTAARVVTELKAARATEDLQAFRMNAALIKRHIGQLHVMACSVERESLKYRSPMEATDAN